MEMVLVTWTDIIESSTEWQTIEDAIEWAVDHNCAVKQLGYIVFSNSEYLLLTCQEITYVPGWTGIGGVTRIPKGCIISIERIISQSIELELQLNLDAKE